MPTSTSNTLLQAPRYIIWWESNTGDVYSANETYPLPVTTPPGHPIQVEGADPHDAPFVHSPVGIGAEFEAVGAITTVSTAGDISNLKASQLGVLYNTILNIGGTRSLDILLQDAAFGTNSTGLAVFGKYELVSTTYADGDAVPLACDQYGRLLLSNVDIQIGAVEIKNATTDDRAEVITDGADALVNSTNELIVGNMNYLFNGTTWDRNRSVEGLSDATLAGVLASYHNAETGISASAILGYDNTGGANAYRVPNVSAVGNLEVDLVGVLGVAPTNYDVDGTGAVESVLGISVRTLNAAGASYEGVRVVDAAGNYLPTGDIIGRSIFVEIGDGTNPVGVLTDGADALVNSTNELVTGSMEYLFNSVTWDRKRSVEGLADATLAGVLASYHNAETGIAASAILGYDNTGGANAYRVPNVSAVGNLEIDLVSVLGVAPTNYDVDGTGAVESVLGVSIRTLNAAGVSYEGVRIADAAGNYLPTGDIIGRSIFVEIGDGTNPASVLTDGADALVNSTNELVTGSMEYLFNSVTWDRKRSVEGLADATLAGVLASYHNAETGINTTTFLGYDNTGGANAYRVPNVSATGNLEVDLVSVLGVAPTNYDVDGTGAVESVLGVSIRTLNAAGASYEGVRVADAAGNYLPTGDIIGRSIFVEIGDGTNPASVLTDGADALVNSTNELVTGSMEYLFNGTTWDRKRSANALTNTTAGGGVTLQNYHNDELGILPSLSLGYDSTTDANAYRSFAVDTLGNQKIVGNIAHDGVDSGNPVKIGGKASASTPTSVAGADRVDAYFDTYGRLHVVSDGGGYTLPANYYSPNDFAVAYTSNVTITVTGAPFTVETASCIVSFIAYKPSGGQWQPILVNGIGGVSLTSSANVITVNGAGTPFAAADTYIVGILYQDKAFTAATNSFRQEEINPLSQQVVEESIVDTTNVATGTYYPSSSGMAMLGYKDLAITGKLIDGAAETTTLTVEATNDEDTATGTWIQIYGYDAKNNNTVNQQSITNGTLTYAWDFDNLNYRYVRFLITTTAATNTVEIKSRRKAL